jgi:glutamate-ammonia-ligase adenylyltransferase
VATSSGATSAASGDAYVFLRTGGAPAASCAEEQQTHTLPADPREVTRLARVLGYRDQPRATALEAFTAEHRAHQATVRAIHERLFFAPLLDTLAGHGPLSCGGGRGTARRVRVRRRRAHARGLARAHERAQPHVARVPGLLPVILDWLSTTPDPDLGLLQLRRLAEGPDARVGAGRRVPRLHRRRPSVRVASSARVACSATASSTSPGSSRRSATTPSCARAPPRRARRCRDGDPAVAHRRRPPARRAAAVQAARVPAHRRRAMSSASHRSRSPSGVERGGRRVRRGGAAGTGARRPVRGDRHGTPRRSRALVRVRHRRAVRVRRRRRRRSSNRRSGSRPSSSAKSAQPPEGQTFRIDARCDPRARRARSRDRSTGTGVLRGLRRSWEFQSLLRARPVAGDPDVAAAFLELVDRSSRAIRSPKMTCARSGA